MAGAGADAPKARLRVRAATAKLIKPGATDLPTIVKCMREIDTALRAPSPADRDDAAAEFCEGPEGDAERSALRWCAAALHRGIPEALHPGDVKAATFTVGVALQILISVSGADHAQQFGHVTRSGAHEAWPKRGNSLTKRRWAPDMWTPTGILPPLLRLARGGSSGSAQIRLRALQLAGSVARDAAAREEMVAGGWLDVAWRALEHRPRPDHTASETKEFIYTRETWQFLQETLPPPPEEAARDERDSERKGAEADSLADAAAALAVAGDRTGIQSHHRVAAEVGEREAMADDFERGGTEWHGRMVRLCGLKARPDLNGSLAFAIGPGGSSARIEVLANPLGVSAAAAASATARRHRGSSPETLVVPLACLSVFESPGLGLTDVTASGALDGAASVAAGASAERDAAFFADAVSRDADAVSRGAPGGNGVGLSTVRLSSDDAEARALDGDAAILSALAEADARRDARDWDAALAACEDASRAAAETCDNKSFARAFVMRFTFACFTEAAEAFAAEGNLEASSSARLGALRCAEQAMDLLEFRALAKPRDGRQGERPTSSLSEFTAEETRFARALVAAGRVEDVRNHFAGASLAVAFARDAYAPVLAGELMRSRRERERREPTTSAARAERATATSGAPEQKSDVRAERPTSPLISESACWRRLSFALRAVDAQRKLGALAVTWRPRGAVGETPGDAAGPGESLGAMRAAGYAAPSALPAGTHRAFRFARGAFLRAYLDLLVAWFAARGDVDASLEGERVALPGDERSGGESAERNVLSRVAAAGAALRVEPLMLQFSTGAFRNLAAEDEAFVAAEGGDEDAREARRARSAGGTGETT